jgi:endoglycosylceramidase
MLSFASAINAAPFCAGAGGHFYDDQGRVRIFHGANRVQKAAPWYFEDMLGSTEFELMQKVGFTALRLGFMWSGYNPAPGVFNQTYMATIKTIIGQAAAHNVSVILDMHQDCFSSNFCLYDGVPQWVANKSAARHAFPWPLQGDCSARGWMANCATEAAAQAYQDLYDNHEGMLDDMVGFWGRAAAELAATPGILGFELINEPFAGDFYKDPLIMAPGVAGRRNLQKMHDAVAAAIRKVDAAHLIFYEPV